MTGRSNVFSALPFLSSVPLPKIFQLITASILLLLTCVLLLGVHQYGLYHQCSQAVRLSDRLLFEFSAVRNVVSESIVGNKIMDLDRLTTSLQSIRENAEQLEGNVLLPAPLKQELINGRDMVTILAGMQSLQARTENSVSDKWAFIRSMNEQHNRLQQFRIRLSDHTRVILQGLHKTIIGTLGIIIVACCSLLFYVNRTIGAPLVELCRLLPPLPNKPRSLGPAKKTAICMNDLLKSAAYLNRFQQQVCALLNDLAGANRSTAYNRLCTHLSSMDGVAAAWVISLDEQGRTALLGCENPFDLPLEELLHGLPGFDRPGELPEPLRDLINTALEQGKVQEGDLDPAGLLVPKEKINTANDQGYTLQVVPLNSEQPPNLVLGLHMRTQSAMDTLFLDTSLAVASLLPVREAKAVPPPGEKNPADTLKSRLFSVNGAMGAETAGILTNTINGTINHCRQLIDLLEAGRDPDIMAVVLERIIREEKKSALLVRSMGINPVNSREVLSAREIRGFLETMLLILEKPMLSESIRFTLNVSDGFTGRVQASLFRLLVPALVHLARKSITADRGGRKAPGQTHLSLAAGAKGNDPASSRLAVDCTISSGRWHLDILDNDPAWPDYEQCSAIMQHFGGEMITTQSPEQQQVRLTFPLHTTQ